jgi:hypothetical protein
LITGLLLQGTLIDKVANSDEELGNVVFAQDFGGVELLTWRSDQMVTYMLLALMQEKYTE